MSEGTRESRIGALTRRLLEEIGTPELSWPDLDPYPGTVDEVADEVVRFVLELERAGIASGLAGMVRDRLERAEAADEDGRATMRPVDDPAEFF